MPPSIGSADRAASKGRERTWLQLLGRLRLKHLRLIEALEREGSLRKASQELNVSQPAASKILQDLEDLLAVQLFDRAARSVQINDFGRFVAHYARRVLGETQRFGTDLNTLVQSGYGTVSVGAIMVTAAELMPAAVAELKATWPGTMVRLVESSSDNLLPALARSEFDFIVGRFVSPRDAVDFELTPLSEEPLCIFTARSVKLPRGVRTLADLHVMQWVIQDSPTPTRRLIERAFATERLPLPPHVVQTSSVYAMLNLVRKSGMIGVLPRTMVLNEGERFKILPIPLQGSLSPYGVITRRGMELSPQSQALVDILVRIAGEGAG